MLSCKEVTELATAYLERDLSFWKRMQFRMHVAMCRHCRAFVDQVRKTVRVLANLPREPVAQDTRAELVRQFREQAAKTKE
jgi:hypothetical protein